MADSTESGVCRGEDVTTAQDLPQTECFIQTLDLYGFDNNSIKAVIPFLSSGFNEEVQCLNNIYGGLFDRCTVDVSAELSSSDNGFEYLNNTVLFINSFKGCQSEVV